MQTTLEIIQSPFYQLLIYSAIIVFIALVTWLYAPAIIIGGVILLILWMLASSIYGIGQSISWFHFLKLAGSLLIGYILLWLLSFISEECGRGATGDGFMILISPLSMTLLTFFPAMIIKGIWQLIRAFV